MADTGQELVRKAGGITQLVEQYEGDFGAIVPSHVPVGAFVGLAISQVRSDKWLREAATKNPGELIVALRQIAQWGHLPVRGTASLVPYYSKRNKRWTITAIEEVDGVRDRIFRAGAVVSVHHELVRQNDSFKRVRGSLPEHDYDPFASKEERGPLMAVYAWAVMQRGDLSHVTFMNRHEVARHRAMSASVKGAREDGPAGGNFWGPEWPNEGPNTEAMWIKTAYHDLERYVPSSSAYREQYAMRAAGAAAPVPGIPDAPAPRVRHDTDPDIVDAEILDPEASGAAWDDVQVATPGGGATT